MKTEFTFDELSDRAKDRVRDWVADYDWWHYTIHDWESKLKAEYGFVDAQIYFSLGYSQSDYVHINGAISLMKLLEQKPDLFPDNLALRYMVEQGQSFVLVVRNSSLVHDFDVSFIASPGGMFDGADPDDVRNIAMESADELTATLQELVKNLSHEIYVALRDEDEYQHSDECVREACDANDYVFDEDGRIILTSK